MLTTSSAATADSAASADSAAAAPVETPGRSRLLRAAKWYGYVSDVLTPQRIGLLLGAALLVIVGFAGGFGAVLEDGELVPVTEAGEVTSAAPFSLAVRRAVSFMELSPAFPAEPDYRYVSVSVDVTNSSDTFVSANVLASGVSVSLQGQRTMMLSAGPTPLQPQIVRTADTLNQPTFQPGLTTNVVLIWQQSTAESIPTEVTITLDQHTWRRSSLDRTYGWRDPVPVTQITLPVEILVGE